MRSRDGAADKDNYFDESIFADAFSSTSRDLRPPVLDGLQSTADTETASRVRGNQKLNYIDEVFFKDTLENLSLNRQPAVNYSEIKKDLEGAVLSGKEASQVTLKTNKQENENTRGKMKEDSNATENDETPKSALEYVKRIRREEHKKKHGLPTQGTGDGSNKSYRKILSLLNEQTKYKYTRHEVLKSLKGSIIYNDHDIVGLHKCYGLAMHGGTDSQYHILTEYLPELAEYLGAEALYPVHRLDATTTGVVLLARTPAMADNLKRMFKERQLKKTYWAILKNIPETTQGIIDIPVAEGILDGRRRMVLKPDVKGVKSTASASKMAVTKFKVISKRESAALVELSPMTGVKHQLRVHMAFGLSCPVLGDHKYSSLKKMAPQALPGDMLDKLKIKQSKVRNLPLFLHCKSITVPEIVDGRNIHVKAKLPAYFNKALGLLKLNRYESKVRLEELIASVS